MLNPHSRGAIRSLGAWWAFSVQRVLLSVWHPVVSRMSGTRAGQLTPSPELGFGLCFFSSLERFWGCRLFVCGLQPLLRGCRLQRLVNFSARPQLMQQHRQLSCGRHDPSFLPDPPTAFR
jgi:hypothetical protein